MTVPVSGHVVAQECQDGVGEIVEGPVAAVVGDVLVHQPPEAFDGIEMGAIGWDEVEFDPAFRPRQPCLHQFGVMISGIVEEEVDHTHAGIHRLDRDQRDCQDFRVWVGIMGNKESHYVTTQRTRYS